MSESEKPEEKEHPEEFSRFEALTKGLLKVPKADVDAKRKNPEPKPK